MSLHPKWCNLILDGKKTIEVRKRAPRLETPFKMYLYCTKPNTKDLFAFLLIRRNVNTYKATGTVCGEVTCVGIEEVAPPFRDKLDGTCLTAKEIYAYAGIDEKLYYMRLADPIVYNMPSSLDDFGQKHPPQSWRYVDV